MKAKPDEMAGRRVAKNWRWQRKANGNQRTISRGENNGGKCSKRRRIVMKMAINNNKRIVVIEMKK